MPFDLSKIFIGRKQQLDQFRNYLSQWKRQMVATTTSIQFASPAAPNNKIPGFVVLLYGRGGFGKSMLLKQYHELAKEPDLGLVVSDIVDWEFASTGKRNLFNPAPGQEVDAFEYFRLLRDQLASALGRRIDEFKQHQKAVEVVKDAKKQAKEVLDSLSKDERFVKLRGLTNDALVSLIRTIIPPSNVMLNIPGATEITKGALSAVEDIGIEQLKHIHAALLHKLDNKLEDYLEPSLRLGLSLGRDLLHFARNFPLLIFFDTYEEIDEADHLLRLVMGASGIRVGWVMAGRDNLWSGLEQRRRSLDVEYGYKDILILPDRGFAVNFNDANVSTFSVSDILKYFDQLRKKVSGQTPLSVVNQEEAIRIRELTQGVPLAVRIAADLYRERADLKIITETTNSKREVVDEMVQRYLLHTHAVQSERAHLYGLALLRRTNRPLAITAALELSPTEAKTGFESQLSLLHRRYSFIFTERDQSLLYPEVRHFLRSWLLEHRSEPEIKDINERLRVAHETSLKGLEDRRHYSNLRNRLEDEEWVGTYLDLTEQQFWLEPTDGVLYCLSFMIAAAIYCRDANREAVRVGKFFEENLTQPYRDWWKWSAQSLIFNNNRHLLSREELVGLMELNKIISQHTLVFPQPFSSHLPELEATLWWRIGEAHQSTKKLTALDWYKKSLSVINQRDNLKSASEETREGIAIGLYDVATNFYEEMDFVSCIALLNTVIELSSDYLEAYKLRGLSYAELKQYQKAIEDYSKVLTNSHVDTLTYYNRGNAYRDLRQYNQAIDDYDVVLAQNPHDIYAYSNRGLAYFGIKEFSKGIADFNEALRLEPLNIYITWIVMWAMMKKDFSEAKKETIDKLKEIASFNLDDYIVYTCRGVYLSMNNHLKEGLEEVEKAILFAPNEWDHYFWKGMICTYLGQNQKAKEAFNQALNERLPPVLLTPLHWLKQNKPAFFKAYAEPLLADYDML